MTGYNPDAAGPATRIRALVGEELGCNLETRGPAAMNDPRMRTRITLLSTSLVLPLHGCALGGAPSLSLFGAYFPSWLLCAVIAVIGAVLRFP